MQSDPLIEPALPILASSLLDLEPDEGRKKCGFDAWKTGIKSLDAALPAELWTGGKVIGIHGSQDLLNRVVVHHFSSAPPTPGARSASPSVFYICGQSTFDISAFKDLDAASLDQMAVMEYFDFAGLTECISEVSTSLYATTSHKQGTSTSSSTTTAISAHNPTIVILRGLDSAIDYIDHHSGMLHANALLASLLRNLTHLSRTYPQVLLLVDLDASNTKLLSQDQVAFPSAFFAVRPVLLGCDGGRWNRALAAGMDTLLSVHEVLEDATRRRRRVVEVLSDRVGKGKGSWAVWEDGGG